MNPQHQHWHVTSGWFYDILCISGLDPGQMPPQWTSGIPWFFPSSLRLPPWPLGHERWSLSLNGWSLWLPSSVAGDDESGHGSLCGWGTAHCRRRETPGVVKTRAAPVGIGQTQLGSGLSRVNRASWKVGQLRRLWSKWPNFYNEGIGHVKWDMVRPTCHWKWDCHWF